MPWPQVMRRYRRRLDPLALRFAGRVGSLADLEHVGRTTGTTRHTPVRAFRRGDVVAVGANFGVGSQWVKNVVAAGTCTMTLRGARLRLTDPQVVPLVDAQWVFPWWFRTGLRRLARTERCLLMTVSAVT